MTRVRRHVFRPSGAADWRGQLVDCHLCPLPADNEIHDVQQPTEEQMAAERRRIGEREEPTP